MAIRVGKSIGIEICVRIVVTIFFFITDKATPYYRKIQPEEYWLYRFPKTDSYYTSEYLWLTLFLAPLLSISLVYMFRKDKVDATQAFLGVWWSTFLAGSITNVIKMGVGRPRPDFLARCFPDGKIVDTMECTGDLAAVVDGYKSFPSGHSSLSFSCLGWISLYLAGKLHVFSSTGRGSAWKQLAVIMPLLYATMIAVSRTADFHHHWQDVSVGSILGLVIAYLVYRQYYPPIQRPNSHLPYISISPLDTQIAGTDYLLSDPMTPTSPKHKEEFILSMKHV